MRDVRGVGHGMMGWGRSGLFVVLVQRRKEGLEVRRWVVDREGRFDGEGEGGELYDTECTIL
jgi:hypothetical protein